MLKVQNGKYARICVFCGSKGGNREIYKEAAEKLGQAFVNRNIQLVYGGGTVGLMGVIASTVQKGLGREGVIGVIPHALEPKEISGEMIGNTEVVDNMHIRKARMAELADGFIAMPGGYGTLEELMEVMTWSLLGFHRKPVALYNVDGYYDKLLQFFVHMGKEGFIADGEDQFVINSEDPDKLLDMMEAFVPPKSFLELKRNESMWAALNPDDC